MLFRSLFSPSTHPYRPNDADAFRGYRPNYRKKGTHFSYRQKVTHFSYPKRHTLPQPQKGYTLQQPKRGCTLLAHGIKISPTQWQVTTTNRETNQPGTGPRPYGEKDSSSLLQTQTYPSRKNLKRRSEENPPEQCGFQNDSAPVFVWPDGFPGSSQLGR